VRLLHPEDEARVRALETAFAGLSLAEATVALAEGRVRDAALATRVAWEPVTCVLPVSARLLDWFRGTDYDEAVALESARLSTASGSARGCVRRSLNRRSEESVS